MARIVTKIGDLFSVPLDTATKKYFQYIANDRTQLNSDVIRAFAKTYPSDAKPTLEDIVNDEVEFYAHVVIKWGIKMHLWEKVGKVSEIGDLTVLFRRSSDYGDPKIKTSSEWYVWNIGGEFRRMGELHGDYRKAEIGVVIAPPHIVHRMRTGEYDFVYPEMG